MQFQHPTFLWAFALLAIPILIHLFNFRRHKTIYFSDIRFLKNIQQATKKQRNIKEWLVLLSRLLALSALILAFAKPIIPLTAETAQHKKAIVVLDNSPSTGIGKGDLSPFERGKQMALKIVEQLPESNEIGLVTAENGQNIHFSTKTEILKEIRQTQIVDLPFHFFPTQKSQHADIYALTDLQQNSLDFLQEQKDSAQWFVIPTVVDDEQNMPNVAIDSAWIEAPIILAGQKVDLFIKLKNYGQQPSEVSLELLANKLPELTLSATLAPGTDTLLSASLSQLESGYNTAEIRILNDEVLFDNRVLQTYFLPISNTVVELFENSPSPMLAKIYQGDEFEFTSMSSTSIQQNVLKNADLIIVNGLSNLTSGLINELRGVSQTSNLFLIPHVKNNSGMNALAAKLGAMPFGRLDTQKLQSQNINTEDPFFSEVFSGSLENAYWPTVSKHFKLTGQAKNPTFNLMQLANTDPLFVRIAGPKANVFQLAVPLDQTFSDISTHPVIVPLFIKALLKKDNLTNFTGTTGKNTTFNFSVANIAADQVVSVEGNGQTFIPQQQKTGNSVRVLMGNNVVKSGTYSFLLNGAEIAKASFNTNRLESDLKRFSTNDLNEWIRVSGHQNIHVIEANADSISKVISEWKQGKQLWKYFLWLALFFVLLEVILLRFLK